MRGNGTLLIERNVGDKVRFEEIKKNNKLAS